MRHYTMQYQPRCGCRSLAECDHYNPMAEEDALKSLVKDFAGLMCKKVLHKLKVEGVHGWDKHHIAPSLEAKLLEHAKREDWLDVANLAMFLWNIDHPDTMEAAKR